MDAPLDIRLVAIPGLEAPLADEARAAGFAVGATEVGGVAIAGGWPEVWRANLALRGASRVLVRLGAFRALHLAQLDRRARRFPWGDWLRPDVALRVEATCRASRIYHAGAARQRVARAVAETLGAPVRDDAGLRLLVRIEDDLCTFSVDASGTPLHQRGFKTAVGKAPLRETIAAMALRLAGFDGRGTVVDPMCGSGTILIEAAEIAAGLAPGRARAFAFEDLPSFDGALWSQMRAATGGSATGARFHGSDRDDGAVRTTAENAARAGVAGAVDVRRAAISDAAPPEGEVPGLVLTNPPYGGRIGDKGALRPLYAAFGEVMRTRFKGWRVGVLTSEATLAHATGLRLAPAGPPIAHGGLRISLWLGDAGAA